MTSELTHATSGEQYEASFAEIPDFTIYDKALAARSFGLHFRQFQPGDNERLLRWINSNTRRLNIAYGSDLVNISKARLLEAVLNQTTYGIRTLSQIYNPRTLTYSSL